jgi:hypothetical protein
MPRKRGVAPYERDDLQVVSPGAPSQPSFGGWVQSVKGRKRKREEESEEERRRRSRRREGNPRPKRAAGRKKAALFDIVNMK